MTWWPFGPRTFLDTDDEEWQIETWRWFFGQFGGLSDLKHSPLVLPTRQFFPPTEKTGHARAQHIFDCVKRLARMPDWPCRLIAQPRRPELLVNDIAALKPITHSPAGTFGYDGNDVVITYEPSSIDDPGQLIATFAHELAHYLLLRWRDEVPGGKDLHEFTTDLLTVYMGFGVFGASAAFNFSSDSCGWRWSRHGYLSQRAWVLALAIFLKLRNEASETVKPFLKQHLLSELNDAMKYLDRHAIMAQVNDSATFSA
jgi:hypothetical protein